MPEVTLKDLEDSVERLTSQCVSALSGVDSYAGAHLVNLDDSIAFARLAIRYYELLKNQQLMVAAYKLEHK